MLRVWVGHVLEFEVAQILPRAHLPRVMGDNEVFQIVAVEIDKHGLEGVVLVVQARFLGDIAEAIVAVVEQHGARPAIAFLVENVLPFDQLVVDIA